MVCYKIAVILIGVVNRTRDPRTGELLDTPLPRGEFAVDFVGVPG